MAAFTTTARPGIAAAPAEKMPFLLQVTTMAWRTLITNIRVPGVILPR
ncbi:MAG: hypothetical protein IPK19_20835 [Chloroflexi bacterium]|nr:hypothetical protein [Chloroflexota bacterium]